MPRPIWSGAISFGLVNVPVKLFSAVSQQDVRFHQLHQTDGARIKQKRVCALDGAEVPYEEIVKGYEVGPDRYVVIEPSELAALDPKATQTIDIEDSRSEAEGGTLTDKSTTVKSGAVAGKSKSVAKPKATGRKQK